MQQPTIICFGEVLWDLLPGGAVAGGAPMNVAFHVNQLGMKATMISKVGADQPGQDIVALLEEQGVGVRCIQTDYTFPTGSVHVTFDAVGSPSYDIVRPVAWDYIHPTNQAKDSIRQSDALVFGSLACRSNRNRKTLLEYAALAPIRVFDINLRAPFYSEFLISELLAVADIVKMNDDELNMLANWYGLPLEEQASLEALRERFRCEAIILTKGKDGAACLDEHGYHHHPGFPVIVKDTVGAGDSFLAAFLSQLLCGKTGARSLAFAGAVGAYVATQQGGTPIFTISDIKQFERDYALKISK
jgi:fructokinase